VSVLYFVGQGPNTSVQMVHAATLWSSVARYRKTTEAVPGTVLVVVEEDVEEVDEEEDVEVVVVDEEDVVVVVVVVVGHAQVSVLQLLVSSISATSFLASAHTIIVSFTPEQIQA